MHSVDAAPSAPNAGYSIGDRVECLFHGSVGGTLWYPAVIHAVHHHSSDASSSAATHDVLFDDGDREDNVRSAFLRAPSGGGGGGTSSAGVVRRAPRAAVAGDSLDSFVDAANDFGYDSSYNGSSHVDVDLYKSPLSNEHPSVVGFLYCTFFDDENLWTAEYDGPNDSEVPVQGHVCEGGYLTGSGLYREYFVDCQVVSGDPNTPGLGLSLIHI